MSDVFHLGLTRDQLQGATVAILPGDPGRVPKIASLLDDPARPFKDAVFSVFLREGIWIAPDGVEYYGRAIRTARHRYVEWTVHETGAFAARELYDHAVDPGETVNVVDRDENRDVVEDLATRLAAGWRAAQPGKW